MLQVIWKFWVSLNHTFIKMWNVTIEYISLCFVWNLKCLGKVLQHQISIVIIHIFLQYVSITWNCSDFETVSYARTFWPLISWVVDITLSKHILCYWRMNYKETENLILFPIFFFNRKTEFMRYYRLCILMQNYSHCSTCYSFSDLCDGSDQYFIDTSEVS